MKARVSYAGAIFLSSALLFFSELIAGKRLLPLLGGSAAVWTACLVFFQCALLLGYLVAHGLATRVSPRGQMIAYVSLLILSVAQLGLTVDASLHADAAAPIRSVLWLLVVLIGVPFITLSSTSPLLQSWYARVIHQAAAQGTAPAHPYRLFAVSNVGSLMALVAYPWLVEPRLSVHAQAAFVAVGCGVLAIVAGAIALSASRLPPLPAPAVPEPVPIAASTLEGDDSEEDEDADEAPTELVSNPVAWVLLSASGSFLLSAFTNHLSQNVATIPLLWIVPLVAYLLTFIIAFSSERWRPRWLSIAAGALGMIAAGYLLYGSDVLLPVEQVVALHIAALFGLCLFCHSELYHRRPPAHRLTTFYFLIAGGGALGAILVGVAAPYVLSGDYEFGIGLVFAGIAGVIALWGLGISARAAATVIATVMIGVVLRSNLNFGDASIFRERNFYGTLNVTQEAREDRGIVVVVRTLYHGVIEHGQEVFREDLHNYPSTYYGPESGVGLAIKLCCAGRPRRIGAIGLGTGSIADYGKAGDVIHFYEINPAVEPIARRYFTHFRDSPAAVGVLNGDARLTLAAQEPQRYDVIAVDAFSGDAIPVHLVTIQALALYRRHLAPGGVIAFHITNRFLNLAPVIKQLADSAGLSATLISSIGDIAHDVLSSDWMIVTDNAAFLARPELAAERKPIDALPGLRLWTDDYNSLLPILKLREGDTMGR